MTGPRARTHAIDENGARARMSRSRNCPLLLRDRRFSPVCPSVSADKTPNTHCVNSKNNTWSVHTRVNHRRSTHTHTTQSRALALLRTSVYIYFIPARARARAHFGSRSRNSMTVQCAAHTATSSRVFHEISLFFKLLCTVENSVCRSWENV